MGEKEKVTIMVLKVDLQCEKCFRKVKKVLCKFHQIRDQTYDEKNNQVIIKVVCCSPEKIRDRLCCKGGGAIKSIDIKEHEMPKPKEPEIKKNSPTKDDDDDDDGDVGKGDAPPKVVKNPNLALESRKSALTTALIPAYPPAPVNACCMDFYRGHPGGPYQTDYGYAPAAPYVQYDGYYGRSVYDSYSSGRSDNTSSYCVTRTDYFSEENPQACVIM